MTHPIHNFAIGAGLICIATSAAAQQTATDTFYQGQVIELSAGALVPLNTLQDTLTTPNGGGATVQSTDALDFGVGPRIGVAYSRPWGSNARLIVDLSAAKSTGDTALTIGAIGETFPGSYDDGYLLPANWTSQTQVETQTAMLRVGREWVLSNPWRISAGLQAGQASQDLTAEIIDTADALIATSSSVSDNEMYGVFAGASYYRAINADYALRVSGTVGVMNNEFTYNYTHVDQFGNTNQEADGASSGTAYTAQIAARIERGLTDHSMMTFEIGYEGISGIGNGADTFLDVEGTASTAHIDEDMIGSVYINVG